MKSDAEFVRAYLRSVSPVFRVACYLNKLNYRPRILPFEIRPESSQREAYADAGDIEVTKIIEVKRRELDFTCADDYPFETVIVDETYKVKRRELDSRLDGYMIVCRDESHACVVPIATRSQWTTEKLADSTHGGELRENYLVDKSLCAFVEL